MDVAMKIMNKAIELADPYKAVLKSVEVNEDVVICGKVFKANRVYVVGFGKAVCPMAKAIEDLMLDRIVDGVVVTKYGYSLPLRKIEVLEGGHPIPDENSLKSALKIVEIAKKVGEDDLLIVLISGGGSALFTLPEDGISLEDKIKTNELLLSCGAKIHEINAVRKHISKVKGGKFAKMVRGNTVSLIVSDVVGDNLEVIASGPTVKDPTTFEHAYRVLKLHDIWDKVPESVRRHIELGMKGLKEETLKKDLPNVHNFLIASNRIVCEGLERFCRSLGYNAHILTTTLEGEAKEVANALGSIIQEVCRFNRPFKKPCVLIAGGEMTVTLNSHGKGGPNQEFALSVTKKISGLNVVVLAFDSDGTDGPTDSAGGIVDGKTLEVLVERGIDVDECLKNHDSYNALKVANALIFTGPTRTNVNSFVIAIVPQDI